MSGPAGCAESWPQLDGVDQLVTSFSLHLDCIQNQVLLYRCPSRWQPWGHLRPEFNWGNAVPHSHILYGLLRYYTTIVRRKECGCFSFTEGWVLQRKRKVPAKGGSASTLSFASLCWIFPFVGSVSPLGLGWATFSDAVLARAIGR